MLAQRMLNVLFFLNNHFLKIGTANLASICKVNCFDERFLSSVLVRDQGAFDGVITAAHELGHLYVKFFLIYAEKQLTLA